MNYSQTNTSAFNTTTTSPVLEDHEIGGILYFITYISDYLPYTILCAIGSVVGLFGNLLIVGAVLCTKELQSMTNMLVFNLALADIVISGFVDSWTVAGKIL